MILLAACHHHTTWLLPVPLITDHTPFSCPWFFFEGFKSLCCLCVWAHLAFLLLKPSASGSNSLSVCFCLAASHPAFPMDLHKCDLHDYVSSKEALSTPPASCHSLNSLFFPSEISSSHVWLMLSDSLLNRCLELNQVSSI